MKRVVVTLLSIFSFVCSFSQVVIQDYLFECYIDRDTLSWPQKAKELSLEYKLNDKGELVFTDILEFEGQTKSELYQKVLNWISNGTTVSVADEEKGRIVTSCYLSHSFKNTGLSNRRIFHTSINPHLKFDFKDGKVRFVYTVNSFKIWELKENTDYVMITGADTKINEFESMIDVQTYPFAKSYPFANDKKIRKKTLFNENDDNSISRTSSFSLGSHVSSRLYVNSIALYRFLKDKMVDALTKKEEVKTDDEDDW